MICNPDKLDDPCVLPDDDGPCETHGTVLCHLSPILSESSEAKILPFVRPTAPTCTHNCVPSYDNLHPEAEHYLDCPVWGFTSQNNPEGPRVIRSHRTDGRARFRGVTPTGYQPTRRAEPARRTAAGLAVGIATVVATAAIVIAAILLLGAVLNWW